MTLYGICFNFAVPDDILEPRSSSSGAALIASPHSARQIVPNVLASRIHVRPSQWLSAGSALSGSGLLHGAAGKELWGDADPQRGRFRSFLMTSVKHFLANERDRARALKRGRGQTPVSIDAMEA